MGRGRAKAKQTKVARALKYGGPQTDLEKLQAELRGMPVTQHDDEDEVEEFDDPYAKYIEDDDGEGTEDDESADGDDDERETGWADER